MTAAESTGRAWIAAGGPLLPGMLVQHTDGLRARVVAVAISGDGGSPAWGVDNCGNEIEFPVDEWFPVVEDAATLGAMLGAVREAWAAKYRSMHLRYAGLWGLHGIPVGEDGESPLFLCIAAETEADVLVAAYKARPVKS